MLQNETITNSIQTDQRVSPCYRQQVYSESYEEVELWNY